MTRAHFPNRFLPLLLVVAALALLAAPTSAQTGFLQIGDIEGEATDRDHRGWIDILSVSYEWGVTQGQSGRTRGRVTYGDLIVVKEIDAATPLLIDALTRGVVTPKATVHLKRGNSVVLTYELANVRITSHAMQDGKEHVSIAFESITIAHPATSAEVTVDTVGGR
ncbi:MAG: type VI secretion system tube protein Hcp [Bacteroidota bacterium]